MNIVILCPVYNDWLSFKKLSEDLKSLDNININKLIAVNDSSTQRYHNLNCDFKTNLEIIDLNQNLGHQRAIAIGLCYIFDNYRNADFICVMDSDGEDDPLEIVNMVKLASVSQKIVFAARKKRHEGVFFKSFYHLYKISFKVLTGKIHDFGNYCIIPAQYLSSIVSLSNIWNHFSGALIKSKIPYERFSINKSPRYEGQSKMNLITLVIHGLSAMSIYLDVIVVRVLLFSAFLTFNITVLTISIVLIRLFTDFLVPGWASTVLVQLVMLFLGVMGISILTVLLVLLNRNNIQTPPIKYYKDFIKSVSQF